MLRITTEKNQYVLTLRVEGRLYGPWVPVLAQCWRTVVRTSGGRRLRVDLDGVTFVDTQGKAQLIEMFVQGAELLGGSVETKAIVAEIVQQARNPNAQANADEPQRKREGETR